MVASLCAVAATGGWLGAVGAAHASSAPAVSQVSIEGASTNETTTEATTTTVATTPTATTTTEATTPTATTTTSTAATTPTTSTATPAAATTTITTTAATPPSVTTTVASAPTISGTAREKKTRTVTTRTAARTPEQTEAASMTSTAGTLSDVFTTGLGTDISTLEALGVFSSALNGSDKPPKKLITIYKAAAKRYGVPWQVLAAINDVETDYGRDEKVSSAGAVGFMQFMPATWNKYEVDADTKHAESPYDPEDAIFAAAKLLKANGGATHLRRAIYSYNHADWYVDEVLFVASQIVGEETPKSATSTDRMRSMLVTAKLLSGTPYVWGGGHSGWVPSAGYDCSGFVSAVLHAAGFLAEPQTTQTLPSANGIESGPGKWVTIFDRTDAGSGEDHVIIDIDGQWWESGGGSGDGGAGSVHRITKVSTAYLASFNVILHPRGL